MVRRRPRSARPRVPWTARASPLVSVDKQLQAQWRLRGRRREGPRARCFIAAASRRHAHRSPHRPGGPRRGDGRRVADRRHGAASRLVASRSRSPRSSEHSLEREQHLRFRSHRLEATPRLGDHHCGQSPHAPPPRSVGRRGRGDPERSGAGILQAARRCRRDEAPTVFRWSHRARQDGALGSRQALARRRATHRRAQAPGLAPVVRGAWRL